MKRLLTRCRLRLFAVAAAAAVGAVALIAVSAATVPFFGAGDAGVRAASNVVQQPRSEPATVAGVTIAVTGFVGDDTRTVVGLSISGRPELGEGALPLGPAQIIDESGRIYLEQAGAADQSNPRLVTKYFPPIDPAARSLILEVNGLYFRNRGARDGTPISAQWKVPMQLSGSPGQSVAVAFDKKARPFGKGAIVLDGVRQAPTGLVLTAHLDGFAMDEVPELGFSATLITGSGESVPFVGLTAGVGKDRQGIEIRFPAVSGAVTVQLAGNVSDPHPSDPALAARLAEEFAASPPATWPLQLPR